MAARLALGAALVLGCGRDKTAAVDVDGSAADAGPGALCVDDPMPLAAETPAVTTACSPQASVPLFSASRPLGFGYPDGGDRLPDGVAYLTFDDGPSDWTGEILDLLASKGVRATFFVNAKNLKGPAGLDGTYTDAAGKSAVFRDVLKRAVDAGHALGNHTVDHLDLASLSVADAAAELDTNERLVSEALVKAGGAPRALTLVRPPFGAPWYHHAPLPADPAAAVDTAGRLIANRGVDVLWTIDSSDSVEWAQGESYTRLAGKITPDAAAPAFAEKVARIKDTVLGDPSVAAHAGAVILLHDTHNATRDALADIIDGLRAAGYTFGTIEELVETRWGRPSLELTPGPALFGACVAESDWGCLGAVGADRAHQVCGRLWRAYEGAGGEAVLGAPTGEPTTDAATGVTAQPFEHGILQLHPERAAPCSAVLAGTPAR